MRSFLVLFFLSISPIINAQNLDSVKNALQKGDASQLAHSFSETIELNIMDENGFYSKTQAKIVLDNFFEKNKPTSYTIKHEGGAKSKSQFIIGTLKSKDKSFRTHILYNKLNDKIKIIEFRIESQE